MNQILIELDDRTFKRLNEVAPPKARKRTEFIREAVRRALDALAEEQMEAAYRAQPQDAAETDLDPETWEPVGFVKARRPRRKRSGA